MPSPDPNTGPAPEPTPPGSPARRLPPVEHRFKKGQSGNPGGRPKGSGVTAALRRLLEQAHNGKPLGELVAERWLKDVLNGKHAQLQMLLDRTEGRLTEKHQLSGPKEAEPVRILICDVEGNEREVSSLREMYASYPQRAPGARP